MVRNDEALVTMTWGTDNWRRFYRAADPKDASRKGWLQELPNGTVHFMTSEQFISHLLPALTEEHPATVTVTRRSQAARKV